MPSFETRAADWLSFGEARDRILRRAAPLETESVAADDALGRALAGPLNAEITLPPWDNSAMDGYAVAAREVEGAREGAPVILAVAREIRPGDEAGPALEPGQAARIMTGAPVPAGADSVVRVEDTDREAAESGRVRILSDRDAGGNVRPAGEDLREGERIYEAGTGIGPGQVAVLTALGVRRVEVHRRPRVAVLASGDELAGPDDFDRVRAGRAIPNSNSPLVAAAARIAGADPVRLGIAADSEESVREHLLRSLGSDVLVTLGGASMGAGDLFKGILETLGFELDFWRVKIRPGSPVSFGFLPRPEGGPLPVLGLPGNPGSAFVTFEVLVRPFLLALAGHRHTSRAWVRARAGEGFSTKPGLTYFLRVRLDRDGDGWRAALTGPQGSGLVSSVGRADGLAVIPEDVGEIPPGEEVRVLLLRDGLGWPDPREGGAGAGDRPG